MSTNYSGRTHHKELADNILQEYAVISKEFSEFQTKSKLTCIEGCGKCCFKPDIYCSPSELLPLALELVERGDAQRVYDLCCAKEHERCMFLNVQSEDGFKAKCDAYQFRPLICRTFGVSARHGKNQRVDISVCKTLQEEKAEDYQYLLASSQVDSSQLPFIDASKNTLLTLDPSLQDEEMPINKALKVMLEKVLLAHSFE